MAAAVAIASCDPNGTPFERMIDQRKFQPYQATSLFTDGRVMRVPPPDTVPRDRKLGDPLRNEGAVGGKYAERLPMPRTRALMERGRTRFEAFCAPCHGMLGDGESMVAPNMTLRRPPPLVSDAAKTLPPGRIFQVITTGYGLMRSYAYELDGDDRWAVVAYLQALQLSRAVPLYALPPAIRARAEKELGR
jgi:mono/diheme cytochrome c family protein